MKRKSSAIAIIAILICLLCACTSSLQEPRYYFDADLALWVCDGGLIPKPNRILIKNNSYVPEDEFFIELWNAINDLFNDKRFEEIVSDGLIIVSEDFGEEADSVVLFEYDNISKIKDKSAKFDKIAFTFKENDCNFFYYTFDGNGEYRGSGDSELKEEFPDLVGTFGIIIFDDEKHSKKVAKITEILQNA